MTRSVLRYPFVEWGPNLTAAGYPPPRECDPLAPPPAFAAYLRDFAAARFFEAHEDLEGLWWEHDSDPFLQGLILFAAAFVKVQRRAAPGARKHFAACVRYLQPYAPVCRGVDVAAVIGHAQAAVRALDAAAPGATMPAIPPFQFRLLPGAQEGWDPTPAPPAAQELETAIRAALTERAASGQPTGPASWGAVVKEVTRRTGGHVPREVLRQAVRTALGR